MNLAFKLAIAAVLAPMIGVGLVYAGGTNITGTVEFGGSGVNDAKATAERVEEYKWDRTDSSGDYDLATTTTNSYTVSSMKTGYTRDSDSVNGGNVAPDQAISTRANTDVKFKVGYDATTTVTLTEARDWLLDGEPWFLEEHSIDFIATTASESWTSGSDDTCANLLTEMNNDIGWTGGDYGGADVLFGFTDGAITNANACINAIPGSGGNHPYIIADFANTADMARTVMHEMTHAYGFSHTLSCTNQIPGVMATNASNQSCSDSIYIKNWVPNDDTTLEGRRSWY
jgi:hypothetical protein